MATLPTRLLEIEFDAGVWTNVTADMVDTGSRRGRNRESGAFEPGHYTFTLRNDTRKDDPENTAGPYYGKLRPNRRCRLRATYNAVTYPVWVGYIDRISQVAGGPNDAVAVFDASDFFKLLNRAELPRSVYVVEVLDDSPKALWPLDEPAGSLTVGDISGNGYTLDVAGAPAFGEAGLVVRDPSSAVLTTSSAGQSIGRYTALPVSGPPITVETWFQRTVDGASGGMVGVMTDPLTHGMFALLTAGTIIGAQAVNGANAQTLAVSTGVNIDDNLTHHIVATWDAAGTIKIYVDGVDRTSGSPTCANVAFADTAGFVFATGVFSDPDTGITQYAAIYNTALSSARIAAHNTAGRTPWDDDTPGTRLTRIFELVATTGSYVLDAGEPTLQATDLGGTVLAYAQKVEETTSGLLFVNREGDVVFVGRNSSVTGDYLTSQATLVDDDSGAGVPYRSGDADVDEGVIVTRATVSREGSVAVTFFDAAARDEFGWLDETHDGLLHDNDAYSLAYAQWIVNTHKAPSTRVGTVALELTKDPAAMYPAILALELGDRVTFKRKPQNVGAVYSADMRVEAISHETGAHYWRTRLQLSPFNIAAGLPVGVWDVTNWDESVWGI
jgi:hypothetical protein